MARFCPLFSGSKGNSYYIGGAGGGILVDIGVSAKRTENALKNIGIEPKDISAIFITHEHSDHISGLRVFASRYKTPVFATAGTMRMLEESGHLLKVENLNVIKYSGEIGVAGMTVECFRTPHDSEQSCGYRITATDGRKLAIATDIGHISDDVYDGIHGCDLVVLESNHDVGMLKNGDYPYQLKRRILSDFGHLSNEVCADCLPELVESGATRFYLGHLSRENNFPELAYRTALCALEGAGMCENRDYILKVAQVENDSPMVVF